MNIVFLCHGNICRSPMAEFMFADILRKRGITWHKVWSVAARTDEIGSDVYPPAKRELTAHGVPFSPRRARLITQADFDEADLIVVMDDENVRDMRRRFGESDKIVKLMSYVGEARDVADPWYTGDFGATYDDLLRGLNALADTL